MPVTRWRARYSEEEWGADGEMIIPATLAATVADREGDEMVTYFGKPYTLRAADPQSVWDFFNSEIDPSGKRVTDVWEYVNGDFPPGVQY